MRTSNPPLIMPCLPKSIELRRSAYIYTVCGIVSSCQYRCATATFCLRTLVHEME